MSIRLISFVIFIITYLDKYYYLCSQYSKRSAFKITMDKPTHDNIRIITAEAIKKAKKTIPMYTGISLKDKQFETGKMTMLRRSLQDIFEHSLDDESIWKWLREFNINSLRKLKYRGWASNRPYPEGHPKFDPEHPDRPKHGNDTTWFYYYTIKLEKWNYWVNVKNHKHYGEVVYVIEKEKPADLNRGHKKK